MTHQPLSIDGKTFRIAPISQIEGIEWLPFSLRIVLENLVRQQLTRGINTTTQIDAIRSRQTGAALNFYPSRIFAQDILGKVMMVDMAALRGALAKEGLDPQRINPAVPVDIIIDHSLQVDYFGRSDASRLNLEKEYARNSERFSFLRWCAESFKNLRVVPPGKGIMHQIHIENIAQVVREAEEFLTPDTCIGTDSHTPMVNGLGVLGWGVGGIEAEAVMLGKSIAFALPRVIGVEVIGETREGVMPTDIVLTITQALRKRGVVDDFVEFYGAGLAALSVADRCTIANMAPEYGATCVYFPIDKDVIAYLEMTARSREHVKQIEAYAKVQRLWRDENTPSPVFDETLRVDLSAITPSLAGPKNPEDRFDLKDAAAHFKTDLQEIAGRFKVHGEGLKDGDVVIAAITSCTNTSNPFNMIAAGLVAQKAAALGLRVKSYVKTSLAPGSQVVAEILHESGLQEALDTLGFNVVGFGCTTCNGGSGPLAKEIAEEIEREKLVATAVLSGNRNFQGRIHPNVRAAYLASPALVVAYALAGSMRVDLTREAVGETPEGKAIFLKDIWPSREEILPLIEKYYRKEIFAKNYETLFEGGAMWETLKGKPSALFEWQENSSYVRESPFLQQVSREVARDFDVVEARALAILGDSITTDDISPSGAISLNTPAADYLLSLGVRQVDFNNYTTRRANHEVAVRATFANIRLKNKMLNGVEGGFTTLQPEGTEMRIFEAAQAYTKRKTPLFVFAGKNYGCGSSRDWAAKGVALLGVKAVIAEGFERIHRTNLVGMGVLPLQFEAGVNTETLKLNGTEVFTLQGLNDDFKVGDKAMLIITRQSGESFNVPLLIRLDTPEDIAYFRHGGILPFVWRDYLKPRPHGEVFL